MKHSETEQSRKKRSKTEPRPRIVTKLFLIVYNVNNSLFKFEPIEYTNAINIVLGLLLFTSPQSTSLSIASPSLSKNAWILRISGHSNFPEAPIPLSTPKRAFKSETRDKA